MPLKSLSPLVHGGAQSSVVAGIKYTVDFYAGLAHSACAKNGGMTSSCARTPAATPLPAYRAVVLSQPLEPPLTLLSVSGGDDISHMRLPTVNGCLALHSCSTSQQADRAALQYGGEFVATTVVDDDGCGCVGPRQHQQLGRRRRLRPPHLPQAHK